MRDLILTAYQLFSFDYSIFAPISYDLLLKFLHLFLHYDLLDCFVVNPVLQLLEFSLRN